MGWSELEGIAHRGDFDLTRPHGGLGDEARVGGRPGALHAARRRARTGREPLDARVSGRCVRRGDRRRARADGASAPPGAGAGEGSRAASDFRGTTTWWGRRGLCTRSFGGSWSPSTTTRADRPPVSPPGRDRYSVRAHDRRTDARGRHHHDPRPRLARSGARYRSQGLVRWCRTGWPRTGRRRRPDSATGSSAREPWLPAPRIRTCGRGRARRPCAGTTSSSRAALRRR